jgi:hypothetical protein
MAPLGHRCRRGAGVIVDVALVPLPLLPSQRWHHRSAGIIATVTLLPFGHRCRHGAGVLADVALAPLPLLPSQRWRHCGAGIIADVALVPLGHRRRRGAGVIADVALAPLPLLLSRRWHHCGALASLRRAGIIAAVALAPLGHRRLCGAGFIADVALRRCHHRCRSAGLIAALASTRLSPWHRLAILAVTALASLQTSPWRRCHCCRRGASVITALASYDSATDEDIVGKCRRARRRRGCQAGL